MEYEYDSDPHDRADHFDDISLRRVNQPSHGGFGFWNGIRLPFHPHFSAPTCDVAYFMGRTYVTLLAQLGIVQRDDTCHIAASDHQRFDLLHLPPNEGRRHRRPLTIEHAEHGVQWRRERLRMPSNDVHPHHGPLKLELNTISILNSFSTVDAPW